VTVAPNFLFQFLPHSQEQRNRRQDPNGRERNTRCSRRPFVQRVSEQ
jgi:hypothetical protein